MNETAEFAPTSATQSNKRKLSQLQESSTAKQVLKITDKPQEYSQKRRRTNMH